MKKCQFLESFIFCPKCAGDFVDNNIKSKKCSSCGFTYYFNSSAAVVAIIRDTSGNILVSTRAHEPAKGTYDLPGGFVDCYESGEEAIIREVKEECNLDIVALEYLFSQPNIYNYSNFDVHTLDMFFECRVDNLADICADDDVESLQFVPIDKIDTTKFGLSSIRIGLERYLNKK